MEVEKTKKERADSLRSVGYTNPWEMLSGAVETTGAALKRVDVLGVGGVVVGAGVVAGTAAFQGVNAVVGVGADFTVQTGRMLVGGVQASSRAVTDVSMAVAKPVVGAGNTLVVKPVTKVVTTTGKVITTGVTTTGKAITTGVTTTGKVITTGGKAITTGVTTTGKAIGTGITTTGRAVGSGITTTGRAVGSGITTTGRAVGTGISTTGRAIGTVVTTTGTVVSTTGRAVGSIVTLGAISWGNPAKEVSPKNSPSQDNPKQLKRPTSINNSMSTLTGISTPQSQ
jgi:hypothetical protein